MVVFFCSAWFHTHNVWCTTPLNFIPDDTLTGAAFRVPLYRVEYSSAIDMWLDKFERTKGPLTIMKADEFRERSINQIAAVRIRTEHTKLPSRKPPRFQAIRSQVVNSGCQHVVIDNLQFLVNQTTMSDDQSSSLERFHLQVLHFSRSRFRIDEKVKKRI